MGATGWLRGRGETVENAAIREAKEETNLDVELESLVGVYSDPDRDPRGHNVSVTFLARTTSGEPEAATDADEVSVLDPSEAELAFERRGEDRSSRKPHRPRRSGAKLTGVTIEIMLRAWFKVTSLRLYKGVGLVVEGTAISKNLGKRKTSQFDCLHVTWS